MIEAEIFNNEIIRGPGELSGKRRGTRLPVRFVNKSYDQLRYTQGNPTAEVFDTEVVFTYPLTKKSDSEILTALKEQKKKITTSYRYDKEIDGINVDIKNDGNLVPIETNRQSQSMINGAWAAVQMDSSKVLKFKGFNNNWIELNATQINALASTISNHVESCFSRENEFHDMIDAATDESSLNSIDIYSGWPDSAGLEIEEI